MTTDTNHDSQSARGHIPIAEWIVAAIGGLLVVASFGFLAYRSVGEREPPAFEFTIEKVVPMNVQKAVTVSVRNLGGKPVADLRLHVIGNQGQVKEVVIDYLPAKSSRRVAFVFDEPPVDIEMNIFVDSFTEP